MSDMLEEEKRIAALEASKLVKTGMTVGLGTGSTVRYFLEALASKIREGLEIVGVPTSRRTEALAVSMGIPIDYGVKHIDIDVDGADEIDHSGQIIKGGGGALFRERIVASNSRETYIICDHTKYVKKIGRFPVPVEISPFLEQLTAKRIKDICQEARLRDNGRFTTDQGNHIIDCSFNDIADPHEIHRRLSSIPGVLDVGIFLDMPVTLILAEGNDTRKIKFRNQL